MNSETLTFKIGDDVVQIRINQWRHKGLLFLNVHENEQTSVIAAKNVLPHTGGILMELLSKGERLVSFTYRGITFTFDPNRMFSAAGIRLSLEEYSVYDSEAAHEITTFAQGLVREVLRFESPWLVALHNTSGEYSVVSYSNGAIYTNERSDLFINPAHHQADFFFTNDRSAFEKIKRAGYNVVLQNNETVSDDGSLSVYCGKRSIRYINIETLHGHKREQEQMIAFIAAEFAQRV